MTSLRFSHFALQLGLLAFVSACDPIVVPSVPGEFGTVSITFGDENAWVSNTSQVVFHGDPGGPFKGSTQVYRLDNAGDMDLHWRAESDQPWILLSHREGLLAAGRQDGVIASVDNHVAGHLPPGIHTAELRFTDLLKPGTAVVFSWVLHITPQETQPQPSPDEPGPRISPFTPPDLPDLHAPLFAPHPVDMPWQDIPDTDVPPSDGDDAPDDGDDAPDDGDDAPDGGGEPPTAPNPRVVYDFHDVLTASQTIAPTLGDTSMTLQVTNTDALSWPPEGGLKLSGDAMIATKGAPTGWLSGVEQSGAFSIEVWVTPALISQSGPARIVSVSGDDGLTDGTFILGQGGSMPEASPDQLRIRCVTDQVPFTGHDLATPTASLTEGVQRHIVYSRSATGHEMLFVDGLMVASAHRPGALNPWFSAVESSSLRLRIGGESGGDRHWEGILHRVALYDQALSPADADALFKGAK